MIEIWYQMQLRYDGPRNHKLEDDLDALFGPFYEGLEKLGVRVVDGEMSVSEE